LELDWFVPENSTAVLKELLRGAIVNRTYGTDKDLLYIYLFLLTIFGPIYYGPP